LFLLVRNYNDLTRSLLLLIDELREDQLYAMIVLENGGVDLESFEFDKLTGWKQAWGTVLQVAKTLAEGEAKARFEVSSSNE